MTKSNLMFCAVCSKIVSHQEVQQPIKNDAGLQAAHFNCGLEWLEKEIEVFKITSGNSYCTLNLMELKDIEPGETYQVEKILMKQGKFYSLPEFKGF